MEKELTSQSAYAKEGMNFFRKNQNCKNTFLLSLGANIVELYLKSIIEQEMGYIPDDFKKMDGHLLNPLCQSINRMNIPHFRIQYDFIARCRELQHYYVGGRYYNDISDKYNIFTDYDFRFVIKMVDEVEQLFLEYEKAHQKYLDSLLQE